MTAGKPHPRNYGAFSRKLSRYVRERKTVGLEAAIRSMIEKTNDAHRALDANAIVAPYEPDAVLFDLAPPLARRIEARFQT